MEIASLFNIFLQNPLIDTDTRKIREGSIFFALKGTNFNGNAFAQQALAQGAKFAVVDEERFALNSEQYILVDDVLEALQGLARYYRSTLDIPVIGITGTNGKTTTKELLYAVMSQRFRTFATAGNLNNHIGVPLSVLSIAQDTEVAIIEMGANHVGEIAFLADIATPTLGLITNVGKAHLEGFGSFEGVKKAKGELYDFLAEHRGTLFLQADNAHLVEMAGQRSFERVIRYGFSSDLDVVGKLEVADPMISVEWHASDKSTYSIATQLTGSYNTENVLAAIAVGLHLGVDAAEINEGIRQYTPKNNRSQIQKTAFNTIIADFYNANASSMAASLDNMEVLSAERKAVILGDMFEMGEESFVEHRKVVDIAREKALEVRIFVGEAFFKHRDDADIFLTSTDELKTYLSTSPLKGYTILLKASRGMAFEKLLDVL